MADVSTMIQIDSELKEEAQELFENLGLSFDAAIKLFLRQSVLRQAIPFPVALPVYNEETKKAIEEARQGVGVSKTYDTVEEALEALNAED